MIILINKYFSLKIILWFIAGPSEKYWEVLAERRRVALQDALEENQILSEQVQVYKEMLDESRALVEVLQV